ncbi:hypothetical protein JCM8202_006116 [Rhodotorula sphaerocarpa]
MSSLLSSGPGALKPRHMYQQEIAVMLLALCAVRDPDEALTQYIEDAVRNHLQQLVMQARAHALRRQAKAIAVDDLVFLLRHDRPRLTRLRTYLSWKDVRKKMRELDQAGGVVASSAPGTGGGGINDDDAIDAIEEPVSDRSLKVDKTPVRTPEPEDDEADAFEANQKRLKDLDALTSRMSREEYEQYSQARQASFVFRKNKKFRDFVALPGVLDAAAAQDEVLDSLGFLAYESVRALCEAGIAHKRSTDAMKRERDEKEKRRAVREGKKRARDEAEAEAERERGEGDPQAGASPKEGAAKADSSAADSSPRGGDGRSSPRKDKDAARKSLEGGGGNAPDPKPAGPQPPPSPKRRALEIPTSLFSAPLPDAAGSIPAFGAGASAEGGPAGSGDPNGGLGLAGDFGAGIHFRLEDVELGLRAHEHTDRSLKASGMRNWRGGVSRVPTRLV